MLPGDTGFISLCGLHALLLQDTHFHTIADMATSSPSLQTTQDISPKIPGEGQVGQIPIPRRDLG